MHKKIKSLLLIQGLAFSIFLLPFSSAGALSGSQFKPGRIIDDAVFYNGNAMSITQIQNFLNSKAPTCDTNGTKMYNSTQTRAQWAAANSKPLPPYICLKSYKQDTPAKTGESGLCTNITAKTGRTSAQIIDDVARACSVNQKVLLILLQKEQSLVTDDWPWPVQYRSATGYGCPDTAPCDSEYYGYFNQVYNAARQYKRYRADPTYFNHRSGRTNYVRYNPNSSCGGTNVYIETQATAGLYNYTPYQPNASALENLYGTGNSCSAYGNRNFWRMYHDWFGSTYANPIKVSVPDKITTESGTTATVKYSLGFAPTANVTIPLTISDSTEGTLSGVTSLTITPTNWDKPDNNVVTITGVSDSVADGDVHYNLIAGDPSSSDEAFNNLDSNDTPNALLKNVGHEPDLAFAGDWNGDNKTTTGLKRGNEYFLNNENDGRESVVFRFGSWEDTALAGDWNGDGKTDIGLKRGNKYYLNYNYDGTEDVSFNFGKPSDLPIVGDWDGDGKDDIGLKRGDTYFFNYGNDGTEDVSFRYGRSTDQAMGGDWNGDGKSNIGLKRDNTFYLNNGNDGTEDVSFRYGR